VRIRRATTLIVAAALAIGGPLAGASVASAGVSSATVTDNGNGTATVTYSGGGIARGVIFCNPSFVADNLTQCNADTYTYVIASNYNNLPPSPVLLTAGMTVQDRDGNAVPLPAGRYTTIALYVTPGPNYTWRSGIQGLLLGSLSGPVPDWLQAVGRSSANTECPAGWNPSWHEWPNGHTGGFVCVRVIPSLG